MAGQLSGIGRFTTSYLDPSKIVSDEHRLFSAHRTLANKGHDTEFPLEIEATFAAPFAVAQKGKTDVMTLHTKTTLPLSMVGPKDLSKYLIVETIDEDGSRSTIHFKRRADDAVFAKAEPVLRGMGETLIRCGAVGSGHAMKALNNYVYAAGLLALSEALRMGARLGLDLGVLTDVMNASSGRNVATETKARQDIISGRYAGGFQLGLMAKDLETAGAIAAETGYDAQALALCRRLWRDAVAALGPQADNTAIHRFLGGNGKPPP